MSLNILPRYSCIAFLLLILACKGKEQPVTTASQKSALEKQAENNKDSTLNAVEKKRFENLNISEGEPIAFRSCDAIAIPLELEERYVEKGERIPSYFNIAVLRPGTSGASLVFEKPVYIEQIRVFEYSISEDGEELYHSEEDQHYSAHFNSLLFLDVYNYVNFEKGKRKLLVYDLKNDKLTQLSPDSADLQKWYIFNGSSRILMYCDYGTREQPDENLTFADFRNFRTPVPALEKQRLLQMKREMIKEERE